MNISIEKFQQSFLRIKDHGTERSFYPALTNFIQDIAASEKFKDIFATAEESAKAVAGGVGFPDVTVRRKDRLVGWVEVKLPEDSLDSPKFNKQFEKYKDALENILFTNFKQWQLWQWGDEGKPVKIKEIVFDVANFTTGEEQNLIDILHQFFSGKAYEARTTKQLALALAKKTKLLSNQVEEAFMDADETSDLVKLKETFEKTLIQNIEPHQFANMVAETVAYSLFLASLEHTKRGKTDVLTLTTAMDYLPASVPILADLYSLIKKVSQVIPNIHQATTALIDQLNAAEMAKIELKLREHKVGEDPVIHFYEPFLNEYDPKEREARGVYYTPKPVVDYIVRSVDFILKEKFGKEKGLADESVHLLDPATGTGTFLMSAIQQIHSAVQKQNNTLGQEMVTKEFNRVVVNHILKHFYGFELLVAPYAIAHLKLTLLLEDLGFDFAMAKDDGDKGNNRLKVYLANTLDDPNAHAKQGRAETNFGSIAFPSIAEESEAARKIKKDAPIIAIIGNPPYSGNSQNTGAWIQGLLKDAYYNIDGVSLGEKNPKWLQDDYVKFIRFAEWKIQKEGQGVIGMITNHGYIDNPTFRGMRHHLIETFDEIYILNLHGNNLKKEKAPDGSKDENVFNIQVGTAICFFVKFSSPLEKKHIHFAELWGTKASKFGTLLESEFEDIKWEKINPQADSFVFNDKLADPSYTNYVKITDIFNLNGVGITTARDNFVIGFEKNKILANAEAFKDSTDDDETTCIKLGIPIKKQWNIGNSRRLIKKEKDLGVFIRPISYRPFDNRYIFYHDSLIWRMVKKIMLNMEKPNLALLCKRQSKQTFSYIFVSNLICESCVFESAYANNSVLPLYVYSDENFKQAALLGDKEKRKSNLSPEIVNDFSEKLGLKFISSGRGDLEKTFGPEDVFYYAYAIFHSPTYRTRYTEQLKIDFPRLPLTSNKELFKKLIAKGNELVSLHLLGENPLDKSKTIFDDSDKWQVSLGGEKTESLEDWKVTEVKYSAKDRRVYVNPGQYFEGVEKEIWEFMVGGYQVCEKWLKDRKKAERCLSLDDLKHYMKIIVSLRETIRIMKEIDQLIPNWPLK